MAPLSVTAAPGLNSGRFHHEGLDVVSGQWVDVDADEPRIRATLLAYVPSHVRVFPRQETELAEAGLALVGGRLVDVRAAELAAATEKKPKKTT